MGDLREGGDGRDVVPAKPLEGDDGKYEKGGVTWEG